MWPGINQLPLFLQSLLKASGRALNDFFDTPAARLVRTVRRAIIRRLFSGYAVFLLLSALFAGAAVVFAHVGSSLSLAMLEKTAWMLPWIDEFDEGQASGLAAETFGIFLELSIVTLIFNVFGPSVASLRRTPFRRRLTRKLDDIARGVSAPLGCGDEAIVGLMKSDPDWHRDDIDRAIDALSEAECKAGELIERAIALREDSLSEELEESVDWMIIQRTIFDLIKRAVDGAMTSEGDTAREAKVIAERRSVQNELSSHQAMSKMIASHRNMPSWLREQEYDEKLRRKSARAARYLRALVAFET